MAALERTRIKIQSPGSGWELAYPSAVTMDDEGLFYILQRGDKADPVLVVDKDGKIVRSWGKGMYEIPHSIRIDPQGNIWTTDSGSSMIYKFTPQGKKLMEIAVGEQPPGRTTGARVRPTSALDRMGESSFPTATAMRGSLNTTPKASASINGAALETDRDNSHSLTESRSTIRTSSTWRIGETTGCRNSI